MHSNGALLLDARCVHSLRIKRIFRVDFNKQDKINSPVQSF